MKQAFKKKVDYILENPAELGEKLQGNLNGLRTFPLRNNFLILYLLCSDCRRLDQQKRNNCQPCPEADDDMVTFILFGPHDSAYKEGESARDKGLLDFTSGVQGTR